MKAELRESFEQELLALVQTLETGVLALEEQSDGERIAEVFRCAHNIKSAAAMLGLTRASGVAHEIESLLEALRSSGQAVDTAIITDCLGNVDLLIAMLTSSVHKQTQRSEPLSEPPTPLQEWRVELRLDSDALSRALDPLQLLHAAAQLGEVVSLHTDDSQLPGLEALDPHALYLRFSMIVKTSTCEDLRSLFLFAEDSGDITISAVAPAPAVEHQDEEDEDSVRPEIREKLSKTLPVGIHRVDALIELATELTVAMARVERLTSMVIAQSDHAVLDRHKNDFAALRRLASRIYEATMTMRFVPLAPTFALLRRYVRDQAVRMNKQVEVVLRGEQIEIDKSMAERLFDPLKHLVRNALDHGIEPPEERVRHGKARQSRLILEARQEYGQVILSVSDDGRGFDLPRIREVAVAHNLIPPDQEISLSEAAELIFSPGFSTAQSVGELSGRGVGLDVVRRNVMDLGGTLQFYNQPGAGVTFALNVPLTLAVIEGLVVCCGEERLIVPLDLVRAITRPEPEAVHFLPGIGKVMLWQGVTMAVVRLADALALGPKDAFPCEPAVTIVVAGQRGLFGLDVDAVLAPEAVLLKGLPNALRVSAGVLAAAVMGDGRVALVLDVAGLESLIHGVSVSLPAAAVANPTASAL